MEWLFHLTSLGQQQNWAEQKLIFTHDEHKELSDGTSLEDLRACATHIFNNLPCQVEHKQWNPKKGVLLESNVQLEGLDQIHHLLQMMNTSNKRLTLSESELHVLCGRWVF